MGETNFFIRLIPDGRKKMRLKSRNLYLKVILVTTF